MFLTNIIFVPNTICGYYSKAHCGFKLNKSRCFLVYKLIYNCIILLNSYIRGDSYMIPPRVLALWEARPKPCGSNKE